MTLSALITDFLEYLELERNASQLTIRNYDHYLKRFLNFSGDIEPKNLDPELIRKYKLYLSGKPLKRVTQNYFLIAIRTFLRYLEGRSIETLSAEKVKLSKVPPPPLKILDDAQLRKLLDAPDTTKKDGLRDRAIMETLVSTGLRVSELAKLNRDALKSLPESAIIPIDKYLKVRKDSFKPLFIRFQGRVVVENDGEAMRLTPRSIQRIVEKYVKQTNLPIKATPHTLRSFSGFAGSFLPVFGQVLK